MLDFGLRVKSLLIWAWGNGHWALEKDDYDLDYWWLFFFRGDYLLPIPCSLIARFSKCYFILCFFSVFISRVPKAANSASIKVRPVAAR